MRAYIERLSSRFARSLSAHKSKDFINRVRINSLVWLCLAGKGLAFVLDDVDCSVLLYDLC